MLDSENYSYSPDYCEFITPISRNKKYVALKALIVFGVAVVIFAAFLIMSKFVQYSFLAFFVLIAVFLGTWYLWRFTSVEYEYVLCQGEMQFDVIFGAKQRKKLYECKVSKMKKIGNIKDAPNTGFDKKVTAVSEKDETNEYYAIVNEENGTKTLLLFEANEKVLKTMKTFNMRAFM